MSQPTREPVVLAQANNDIEAAAMVAALDAAGIQARAVGGFIAGFRAEAPGDIQIVVPQEQLAEAREILREIREAPLPPDSQTP